MHRAPWRRVRAARGERRPGEGGPGLTLVVSFLTLAVAYGLSFTFPVFYVALLSAFGQGRGLIDGKPAAYVCRNRTCEAPLTSAEVLRERCST